ncbi:MAG: hypothetical protein NTV02_03375 [Candidatus Zambryskibacteria bacterium]|nr:hypothetical protein [Candidatus Zambryskibacteria bacterium]
MFRLQFIKSASTLSGNKTIDIGLSPGFVEGLCRLDEVVELINKQFGVRWTKKGLLQRFAIPREEGRIKVPNGTTRYDLDLIWVGDVEIQYDTYNSNHVKFVDAWTMPVYVSSGWVKDVFWALYVHCTRAKRSADGRKIACLEDGSLVFDMVGTGYTNLKFKPKSSS